MCLKDLYLYLHLPGLPVDCWAMTARASSVLRQLGVERAVDLEGISPQQLRSAKGCGRKTADEITFLASLCDVRIGHDRYNGQDKAIT
jgi:hypothetical protein